MLPALQPQYLLGFVCEKVAHRHGRPMLSVMRDPWALTLFTFAMIVDAERIEELHERVRDGRRDRGTAYAFHKPDKLDRESRQLATELRTPPDKQPKRMTDTEFKAQVNELLARRGMGPRYVD